MTQCDFDYILVGQGICGTFLSYYLLKAGKKVLVIDEDKPFSASKVASGIINPVTGRRIVKTWRIDELLPFALDAYTTIGNELNEQLVTTCDLLDFHATQQMKEAFEKRLTEEPEHLHKTSAIEWNQSFRFLFGAGKISPCLLININSMLSKWRQVLTLNQSLLAEHFEIEDCTVDKDCVTYKSITATKMIFCDGIASAESSYFKNLPFAFNKGEAVIATIPGLPSHNIYKQGISIVPWKNDQFWIGSSYEWNFADDKPTSIFKEKIKAQLSNWLKLPFEITDHVAAVRPANLERRPFVGLHPVQTSIGIFNGMGTKGCSLAPFFAKQFADFLVKETAIDPDASVQRFEKVLARKVN